jgi:hypothetical protein
MKLQKANSYCLSILPLFNITGMLRTPLPLLRTIRGNDLSRRPSAAGARNSRLDTDPDRRAFLNLGPRQSKKQVSQIQPNSSVISFRKYPLEMPIRTNMVKLGRVRGAARHALLSKTGVRLPRRIRARGAPRVESAGFSARHGASHHVSWLTLFSPPPLAGTERKKAEQREKATEKTVAHRLPHRGTVGRETKSCTDDHRNSGS